ncbi:MAG: sugar-binding protein [Candidatus Omnitrophota bacterium]
MRARISRFVFQTSKKVIRCHPERSEGSHLSTKYEILRYAQNDKIRFFRKSLFQLVGFVLLFSPAAYGHLCDNVFRQADKLIVKPELTNITVKDKAIFKVFLQNNMDRGIAEISLLADSPAFNFVVVPDKMPVPKDQRKYFEVTMIPKPETKTGNYTVDFRLVGGGRLFKSFTLGAAETEKSIRAVPSGILEVKPTLNPPKIDGLVNDDCWKTGAVLANFSSATGGQVVYQTTGLLTFDRKALYLGFYAADEQTDRLTKDDRLEILLSTEDSGYPCYSFTFSPVGYAYARKFLSEKEAVPWSSYSANYRITKNKGAWTAEVAIPFSALNVPVPTQKEKYYLRVNRAKTSGYEEKSFWSADGSGYNSDRWFGQVFFVP